LVSLKPLPNGQVSIGSDLHEKLGSQTSVADPSGSESFLDLDLKLGAVALSIGEKLLRSTEPPGREGAQTEDRTRLRSRLDIEYKPRRSLWLRARYEDLRSREEVGASQERSSADLLRIDIGLEIGRMVTLRAGAYTFSVGDYASRLYQYEAGLPYYPTLQMLKSDGSRWYSTISFHMGRLGKFTAKYGRTVYNKEADRSELLLYCNVKI
jgi:hypothetical protein